MEISQLLLGNQVAKLEKGFMSLQPKLAKETSLASQACLGQIEKNLRQVEKLRTYLNQESNSDVTLQVLYLNFRDLKLKYRMAIRQFQRRHTMGLRTRKLERNKVSNLVTVAA